jgi:hypothetical protein
MIYETSALKAPHFGPNRHLEPACHYGFSLASGSYSSSRLVLLTSAAQLMIA